MTCPNCHHPPPLPLPQELHALSSKIDEALAQGGWGGVFVRLSDRSPKDAVYETETFWKILDTQLQGRRRGIQA